MGSLDDDIEFMGVNRQLGIVSSENQNGGVSTQALQDEVVLNNYSYHNHQMGRLESFAELEWVNVSANRVINNDSLSYSVARCWKILGGGETLTLYRYNGEEDYEFTIPSSGSIYGSTFRFTAGSYKEFRGIQKAILHFTLRQKTTSLDTTVLFRYVDDQTDTHPNYGISIGPLTIGNPNLSLYESVLFRKELY
ncbi:MAG: hypothetical protein U0M15_01365 [Bacillota bacterium]|nr:hypothetical protein [Bacillota bacterium]